MFSKFSLYATNFLSLNVASLFQHFNRFFFYTSSFSRSPLHLPNHTNAEHLFFVLFASLLSGWATATGDCLVPIWKMHKVSSSGTQRCNASYMRSQVQASEMRFLRSIEGVTLFNKVRSSEIRKSLNIEPLLLRIERSQLRWFGHVSKMPQERLPKQALHAKANGRRPVGRPRTRWTDHIEDLGWNRSGLRPSEMMEVMEDREVWRLNLELLPPQPSQKSG